MVVKKLSHAMLKRLLVVGRGLVSRRMAGNGSTHMERTQASSGSEVVSDVEVLEIEKLSPTVKGYTLAVKNTHLKFHPGQWVDLHIPEEDVVGGYSITSAPHQLAERGTINLAIQHSDHPPTYWMTTKCSVGDELQIRVGGDFFYSPPTPSGATDLLLIAGGVGINPLISMLQHHVWLLSKATPNEDCHGNGAVQLLFSAKNEKELIFKDKLDRICSEFKQVNAQYFVTQKQPESENIQSGRISAASITAALSGLQRSSLRCYVCGPPPMLDAMVDILISDQCSVDSDRIHFEKWW